VPGASGFATRGAGAIVRRLEDPRLLRGAARFLDDLSPSGVLHAAFVRSPHAHARLLGVDARAVAGVAGASALTGAELGDAVGPLAPRLEAPGFAATSWPVLARARVRFAGEPVAVVAAPTPYAAADAAGAVAAAYAPLPPLPGVAAALAEGAEPLHPGAAGNVLYRRAWTHGDTAGALRGAAVVVRERFRHDRCSAAPLEPRGVLAAWEEGRLTAWAGTQVPQVYRAALARAFGLDESRVRVMVPDTGGGFGQKMHVTPEDVAVAALARIRGRPVKWVETRRENLAAAAQAREAAVDVEAGFAADGALLGVRARVCSDAGAYHVYPLTQALEPLGTASILPGPYRLAAYDYEVRAVATTKPPLGAYRGVGMALGALVMERVMDLAAARLGLDPAAIRRRNLLRPDDYPYASAAGLVYDSGDFPAALDEALRLADYDGLTRAREAGRRAGRLLGVGIACYTEYTGIGAETYRRRGMADMPGPEAALVRMLPDGAVQCAVSFPAQGQGHATTVAQVVAAELGVPPERVAVLPPDGAAAPPGTGTFASRGIVVQLGSAGRAATRVRGKLLALAAGVLEASAADLVLADGRVSVRGAPDHAVAVADLARLAYAPPAGGLPGGLEPGLEATQYFDPPGPAFSGAVHVAAVEVDPDTGRVTVLRYAVAEDCGPVLNPTIVEGQVHGAVAQGVGEALGERLVYDEAGQLLTGTLMDYALPVAATMPAPALAHLETPSPLTPGGVKGMGEGGTIGAPAAIANAVADAVGPLGLAVTALPILPEGLVPLSPGR
jgi:carbon-monoxide dehydrogenase large subunit